MSNNRQQILILFGGVSSEHEVSRNSTASILRNIDREAYEVTTIGITHDGRWYLTTASAESIADGSWEEDTGNRTAFISPDRAIHGIVDMQGNTKRIDCVIPMLHGRNGEDGTMQGLLEIAGIPYVGPGVLASAVCMDKGTAKIIAESAGINQAKYYVTYDYRCDADLEGEMDAMEKACGPYPLFIKPANAGSSVGISKAENREELKKAIALAEQHDHEIVAEETIVGRELEVAVIGNSDPKASPVGEIQSAGVFYDYESKYSNPASIAEKAENLPEKISDEIRATAVKVYKLLGCRGLSRCDFFLRGDEVIFNEVNTMPGFTNISMYPKLWGEAGLGYRELITKLIELALEEK